MNGYDQNNDYHLFQQNDQDMPPYFKFLTIMAYYIFLKENVEVAVIEVGIGGEYDCTNVVRQIFILKICSIFYVRITSTSTSTLQKYKNRWHHIART